MINMDFVYGLTFVSLAITLLAQAYVTSSYNKYIKIKNEHGFTGEQAARRILDKNGLENIQVVETKGNLTDHYDLTKKIIKLSQSVYRSSTIGAVSIACHECGHAIQDKENYTFMRIRSALVPFVNFSSYAGYFAILLGCIFSSINLIYIGIFAEVVILLFQLITLPVEINASKRALKELDYSHILNNKELKQGRTMLIAAALTYVASVATTIIQILRLILMYGRRERK